MRTGLPRKEFWRGRRVLLTGHTGFKGSWASLWLSSLGAKIHGFSIGVDEAASPYRLLSPTLAGETFGDVRDSLAVSAAMAEFRPDVVIHMAAQPLVRLSYAEPISTFAANIMGTVNVLDAARNQSDLAAVLVVTTDKVYENLEKGEAFAEHDKLGGHDPYSASKACAEIVSESYRRSFFSGPGAAAIATARSGNVIGGGDMSTDRIVPDMVRAMNASASVRLRYPLSVRPWLHVLEPLGGYLSMVEALVEAPGNVSLALNFAPDPRSFRRVEELVARFSHAFGGRPGWIRENGDHPLEAGHLTLDASRVEAELGWRARLSFEETVDWTADWYRARFAGENVADLARRQIAEYEALDGWILPNAEPTESLLRKAAT